MQYDLNQLSDPKRFQRLVNAILTARFGEDARLTPIDGPDGGSDGETAPDNPYMQFRQDVPTTRNENPLIEAPRPGRYVFQAKYHITGQHRISDLRTTVAREFREELSGQVMGRLDRKDVNYFFLVTNVKAGRDSYQKIDDIREELLKDQTHLHADVWWGEKITAALDWAPHLWISFPELFPGRVPPFVGLVSSQTTEGLTRTLKLAISNQYNRDKQVKFRQIELEKRLLDIFVDLNIGRVVDTDETNRMLQSRLNPRAYRDITLGDESSYRGRGLRDSVLDLLLDDRLAIPRILLEGGPGQGKSTITQMAAQIYREKILGDPVSESRDPIWHRISQLRVPIRIELRDLAEWASGNSEGTLEQYVASYLTQESGGAKVHPEDIHDLFDRSSVILILDGLDEIGNDALRDQVLDMALQAIERFETAFEADVRVVLTTRPPAVNGRWVKLKGFVRVILAPMSTIRIDEYLERWLQAQIPSADDKDRIRTSFNGRRNDSHVEALARNPMQLSVLLQFIYLKGEAFPDRRAELYHEYFQIVIDRDVEKSPELREHRDLVNGLHSYLGFLLQGFAEKESARGALDRNEILLLAGQWLDAEGHPSDLAEKYFALGEERFGLIVALSGEGHETSYGFEIQPIREYFAAAYISDRLANGQAHEVFQTLIYNDYWREVALFLAGLRRPNEKADLVGRAKEADSRANRGQENGRAIVLQLLREGVLSQPRHVQTQAMSYALGFLAEPTLKLQRNPRELIDSLSELVRIYGSEETREVIVQVAKGVGQSSDNNLVSLMYRIAGNVLPRKQYLQLVREYSGSEPEALGLVRISRALKVPGVVDELSDTQNYLEGIPAHVVARRLWSYAMSHGSVPDIKYPAGTHLNLAIQFAVQHPRMNRLPQKGIDAPGASILAIWKLYQNIQAIKTWFEDGATNYSYERLVPDGTKTLLWGDEREELFPQELKECIGKLFDSSSGLISVLGEGGEDDIDDSFASLMETVVECLEEPGIAGWIAARCAGELYRSSGFGWRGLSPSRITENLSKTLNEIYGIPEVPYHRRMLFVRRFGFGYPLAMRMKSGYGFKPLHEIIADFILGKMKPGTKKDWRWLEEMTVPALMIRPLIDICHGSMEAVLRFIGSRVVSYGPWSYGERRLKVQHTRRVLNIARQTQDKQVLQGVASVLVNAKFSRIVEPALMEKILAASPSSPLVARVFNTHDTIRQREEEPDLKELALKVAPLILGQSEIQPFRVVNRAASFLAEAEAQRNKPLFEENPELQRPCQV